MFILEIFTIIITIFALFYTAMIYTSPAILLFTFMSALFSLLAFLYLAYIRHGIKVGISAPIGIADEGQSVKVRLTVVSERASIIPKCQFLLIIRNCNDKASVLVSFRASDVTKGENVFDYEIKFKDAGCYEAGIKKIKLYDLFGLVYCTKKLQAKTLLRIMPEPVAVGVTVTEPVRNFSMDADEHDENKPGADGSEIFGIREYAPGDKIQSIHWKLTAKSDELMVKEGSLPKACPVVLFLEYKKGNVFGSFLKLVAGISFSMVEAACPHYIAWFDGESGDVARQRVDSFDSYYQFFCNYLKDHKTKSSESVAQLYNEKFRYERYLHGLSVNDDLSVTEGDLVLLNTTEIDLKTDLGGMELVF